MQLKGATVLFLGDSITEGHVADGLRGFVTLLQERYGVQAVNYGLHDTRIAPQRTPSPYPLWDEDFIRRATGMQAAADCVMVFGGTNDFGTGDAPLGRPEDATPATFAGACRTLFGGLANRYPHAVVAVATPLHRLQETRPDGRTLADYADRIRQVAQSLNLPVLDLFAHSRLDPRRPGVVPALMPDGLHPGNAGHALLAEEMAAFLRGL